MSPAEVFATDAAQGRRLLEGLVGFFALGSQTHYAEVRGNARFKENYYANVARLVQGGYSLADLNEVTRRGGFVAQSFVVVPKELQNKSGSYQVDNITFVKTPIV